MGPLVSAATHSVLTVLGASNFSHPVLARAVPGRMGTLLTKTVINTTSAMMGQQTCMIAQEGWFLPQTRVNAPGVRRPTDLAVGLKRNLSFPARRLVLVNTLATLTLKVY